MTETSQVDWPKLALALPLLPLYTSSLRTITEVSRWFCFNTHRQNYLHAEHLEFWQDLAVWKSCRPAATNISTTGWHVEVGRLWSTIEKQKPWKGLSHYLLPASFSQRIPWIRAPCCKNLQAIPSLPNAALMRQASWKSHKSEKFFDSMWLPQRILGVQICKSTFQQLVATRNGRQVDKQEPGRTLEWVKIWVWGSQFMEMAWIWEHQGSRNCNWFVWFQNNHAKTIDKTQILDSWILNLPWTSQRVRKSMPPHRLQSSALAMIHLRCSITTVVRGSFHQVYLHMSKSSNERITADCRMPHLAWIAWYHLVLWVQGFVVSIPKNHVRQSSVVLHIS